MIKVFPLTRSRAKRTRTAIALAAAGTLVLSTGAVMLSASSASADHKDSHNPGGQGQGSSKDNGPNNDNGNGPGSNNGNGPGNNNGNGPGNNNGNGPGNNNGNGPDKTWYKSYVCKYVGKPGVDERLQTGRNPIWVSNASLGLGPKGLASVGQAFNDRQGRSVVIVANTGKMNPEPSVANCPQPTTPSTPPPGGPTQITPSVSFTGPTCQNFSVSWSGTHNDVVNYVVSGTPAPGNSVTVTAAIKPSAAGSYTFPSGFDNTFDHTFPTIASLQCVAGTETTKPKPKPKPKPEVKGSESTKPRPAAGPPAVLGTQASVPTAVAAGLPGTPASASTTTQALAELLVGAGLLLLVAAGWMGLGRRDDGTHQA